MALTPEDVLNKNFTATQFRRGYDEQEVDDFLDEVVAELRRLSGENADLRRKVDAGGMSPETQRTVEAAEREAAERIAKAKADAETIEAEAAERIAKAKSEQEEATAAQASATEPASSASSASTANTATSDAAGLIALAQKVHDEYVQQGKTEHDRVVGEATSRSEELLRTAQARHDELLSTGQSEHDRLTGEARLEHDRLLTEARERSGGMLAEAEQRRQAVIADLESERVDLDQTIGRLRDFEQDYRGRLRAYIESQLQRLGETAGVMDEPVGAEPEPDQQGAPAGHGGPEGAEQRNLRVRQR